MRSKDKIYIFFFNSPQIFQSSNDPLHNHDVENDNAGNVIVKLKTFSTLLHLLLLLPEKYRLHEMKIDARTLYYL